MVIEEVKPAVPAALVSDLSGLVKSLQSLKRCLTVEPLMCYVEDCLMNLKVLKW